MSEEDIFAAALERPPKERSTFLHEICGDDTQLRARVEQLLKAHDDPDSIFDSPAQTVAPTSTVNAKLPKRLGDFEIIRQIGQGGMGIVYEARQLSLNRRVALKVLSSGLGLTAKAVMRFRREAEAAAKLHHTNIVPIYATGEDGGVHFYAMELIEGPSLDRVIQHMRGGLADSNDEKASDEALPGWVDETIAYQLPCGDASIAMSADGAATSSSLSTGSGYFDAVAKMVAEVADALDHAHDQGVIHRDIKPSNLLLAADARLSVNDFGLARMLEQPGMTMTGEFVGSPLYMSPEQITAGRAPLDHRTDIYSLGATLYELLTLEPPYPGTRRDQVIGQIMHKEAVRPRRKNKRVPVDLETICLKAIEKDPDQRYQTAAQLAEDLRRFVNRHAISARKASIMTRAGKWVRRHPSIAASLLIVFLACVTTAWFAYSDRVSRARIAEMEKQRALREIEIKLDLTKERAFSAAITGNFAEAERQIKELERLNASPGWVRMINGQIAVCQGNYEKALDDLVHARQLLNDSLATLALLTHAYMQAGDEISYYRQLTELRKRSATTFEEHLFKGLALEWGFPAEAILEFNQAQQQNDSTWIVALLRSRARQRYALDQGSLNDARLAKDAAAALRELLPNNPIPVEIELLATLNESHLLAERGDFARSRNLLETFDLDQMTDDHLRHCDVRWARWQFFVLTGQAELATAELERAPLRRPDIYLALFAAADLYRQRAYKEALKYYNLASSFGRKSQCRFAETFIRLDYDDPEDVRTDLVAELPHREDSVYLSYDWMALKLLGDNSSADMLAKRIEAVASTVAAHPLEVHVVKFIGGRLTPPELEDLTRQSRRMSCYAYFVLAVDALADGDRASARDYLRKCEQTGYFMFYDFHWARAFAERLDSGDEWLPWLPNRSVRAEVSVAPQ